MKDTQHKKYIVLFCTVTAFLWFSLFSYVPELSTYAEELGANYKMIGIIGGGYGLAQVILRIPIGITSDELNRRKIFIIIGLLIAVISSLVVWIKPGVISLLITRLLGGVAASTWVTFTVLFSSYYPQGKSTKAIGILTTFIAVGQVTAMLLGGIISLTYGTRYLFLLSICGGTIGLILSLFLYENKNTKREPLELKSILKIAKDEKVLYISFLEVLSQLMTFATLFGFTPLIAKKLGAEGMQLSFLTILGVLPAIILSSLVGTVFIKWWGEKKTLLIGFAISSLVCVIMPFVPTLNTLYIIQVISGIGRTFVFPLLMGLVIKHVDVGKRATAMGFFQAIYGIGMLGGPILLGIIGDKLGLRAGFVMTGTIGLSAIVFIGYISKKDIFDK